MPAPVAGGTALVVVEAPRLAFDGVGRVAGREGAAKRQVTPLPPVRQRLVAHPAISGARSSADGDGRKHRKLPVG